MKESNPKGRTGTRRALWLLREALLAAVVGLCVTSALPANAEDPAVPSVTLIKENGFQWLGYLSPDVDPSISYADPKASEADFLPWDVTAGNGNWTPDLIDAQGLGNGNMHGWLRLHVTLPAGWATSYKGDLRLYGFNFNAAEETFFNGTSIGKTGTFPEDPNGFVRDADTIRSYLVPENLVNWAGDNVIAIHGYHDGGTGGFTSKRPVLAATRVGEGPATAVTTGLKGTILVDGRAYAGGTLLITDGQDKPVALAASDPEGKYLVALAAGTYKVKPQVTSDYGTPSASVTVEAGKVAEVSTFDLAKLPSVSLIKENGFQWKGYLSPDLDLSINYADPKASEANFLPWDVTAGNGNWTPDLIDAQGLGNGNMHGWLRLRFTLPPEWGQRFRGDLRLYGFNFNAAEETFFNGTSIGKTGTFPEDPDGFVRDADTLRNYTIPANLVNWEGENVLAIHGYHDGGTGGFTSKRPILAATVSSGGSAPVVTTGLQGTIQLDGAPTSGINVLVKDAEGNTVVFGTTDGNGKFLIGVAPGTYQVEPQVAVEYGTASASVTVEANKVASVPTFNLLKLPSLNLVKENGFQWLAYVSPDVDPGASYADPKVSEADFVNWDVTAGNGNWTAQVLDVQGIANGDMHGWARLHLTLPAEWGQNFRGPLRLHGFNFNASEETFFNGTSIGKTGTNPPGYDRTGFVRNADTIRNYLIPENLVNWSGDNVIAIHGFHDGGTGGFTSARPLLTATTSTAPPPGPAKGDLNGNGRVEITDVLTALQVVAGLKPATPDYLAAGDLNANGKLDITEVVTLLRVVAGLAQF